MFSRLEGLAPFRAVFSSPLSLRLFSRACIRVPPLLVSFYFFLLLAWALFTRYGNVCFTFPVSYWAIPLKCWQCLIYFFALCGCIVHYVCIPIFACIWVIVNSIWWTLVPTWVTLSSHESSWPYSVGMCSRRLSWVHIHAILSARSLQCDCLGPCHQVMVVSLCMWHASTCLMLWRALARLSLSMSIPVVYTDVKPFRCAIVHQMQNSARFFAMKMGHPHCHSLTSKAWLEQCFMCYDAP